MNYTYEIETLIPKGEFMTVKYSAEGFGDYFKSFNPKEFSEEHLRSLIEGFAPFVVEFWERSVNHPEELIITGASSVAEAPVVEEIDSNHAPEIEPQPEYNRFTQRIEMNQIEHPMQETVGWAIIELTEEERASTLENFKSYYRVQRDVLLSETDHWMMSDTPEPTQAQLDYRQALRDVPEQAEYPQNIIWPTKPE